MERRVFLFNGDFLGNSSSFVKSITDSLLFLQDAMYSTIKKIRILHKI